MTCCSSLRQLLGETDRGFAVRLVLNPEGAFAFFLLSRSSQLPAYGDTRIEFQYPIFFCPFCGADLQRLLVEQPELATRWARPFEVVQSNW